MTLALCAKDVRFYQWPNISFFGIYETPSETPSETTSETPTDCMTIKSISWCSNGEELVAVKGKGCPVILHVPANDDDVLEAFEWSDIEYASVGTFSNRNPELVAFGADNGIFIYNIRHTRSYQEYIRLPSPVQNIEFSSDDQSFSVGCASGQIFLFNSNYKPCASFFVLNSPTLSTLAYSKIIPHLLAAASKDGMLSLWNTETSENILSSRSHTGKVTDMTFFESILSSVGIDGKFVTYDLRAGNNSCCCDLECPLSSLAYLQGTNELAISTMTGQLRSYDSRNMETPLKTLVALPNSSIKKIAFPFKTDVPRLQYLENSEKFSDNCAASGDFSLPSGSSPNQSNFTPLKLAAESSTEESHFNYIDAKADSNPANLEELGKIVEETIKIATKEFEDKLLRRLCDLRLETSKQFAALEEKMSKNWDTFMNKLRVSGQESIDASIAGVSGQNNKKEMDVSRPESNCASSAGVSGQKNKYKMDVFGQESNCTSSAGVSDQKNKHEMDFSGQESNCTSSADVSD